MNPIPLSANSPVDILIAEDSPTQAQRLRHILEQQGYHVVHAANGRLALEAAERHKPTIIISDVVMPEMDGYELCRRIKADARLGDIPIILVTTLSDPGDVIRGLECRADNFILKPYDEHYLLGRVQFVLLNRQTLITERATMGVEVFFNGQRHFITADRLQILNLLLSTYDAAIQRTKELIRAQEELLGFNRSLGEANLRLEQVIGEREQAEAALRVSGERFQIMARATNDVVWDWDILTNGLWWSEAFKAVFGYRAEEIEPGVESWSTRIHPEDAEWVLADIHRMIDGDGHRWSGEYRFRRADGSFAFIFDRGEVIRDAQGKAVRMVGAMMDITDRKRTEAALRDSAESLAVTLQSIGDAVLATDAEGRITRLNAAAEQLTGWTQAEAVGRAIVDVFHIVNEETRQPAFLPVAETLAKGAIHGLANHTVLIARDGTERLIADSCAPIRDREGGVTGAVLVFRDVTAERAAEAELRRSRVVFENLFMSLPGLFLVVAPDLKIVTASDAYLAATMTRREEIRGRDLFEVFPDNPDDPLATGVANLRASLDRVRRNAAVDTMVIQKYPVRRPDGVFEDRYWSQMNSPVLGADRQIEYIIHRVEDVTEFVRQKSKPANDTAEVRARMEQMEATIFQHSQELDSANRKLHAVNAELARASKLKDEFLANMSHELRTPLNAILGLSESLLEQVSGPLSPRQIKAVTTISTSGQHLLALINDILDLSKIEAGKLELHGEPLNVDEFCQSCLAFVRTQAMQKHIGVAFEHDGRATNFVADPKRFKQALVNLLTNAVKFTPEGGRIGLTVSAPEGGDVVDFTVWDTGIGIAPEDAAKLFRAFTQIDSGLSRAQDGTGLGLALVAKLVELHGGSITLESEPAQGSRFIVKLPQIAAPSRAPAPAPKHEADRRGYRRALIIDDDPTSGAILANYLTELGLSTVLHPHGEESVESVLRERPDMILLDVLLPGESGWVVLARLKEHPGTRDIPVIVVSVVDEPETSRTLGAVAHFTKPITRAQLANFFQRPAVEVTLPAPLCVTRPPALGPHVLLAEDNEANIQTIGGYLEDMGYAMHYARNGLVAVKLARELNPALILMDIQMPVMDGLTAIGEIRADTATSSIPIVALTALAMPGDRERCLAAGAADYLSKPVSLKALVALMGKLLPHGGQGGGI